MLNRHLDDFRLFDATAPFLHVRGGQQTGEVGQTVVHPVTPSLLDDSVRLWVTRRLCLFREGRIRLVVLAPDGRKVQVPMGTTTRETF